MYPLEFAGAMGLDNEEGWFLDAGAQESSGREGLADESASPFMCPAFPVRKAGELHGGRGSCLCTSFPVSETAHLQEEVPVSASSKGGTGQLGGGAGEKGLPVSPCPRIGQSQHNDFAGGKAIGPLLVLLNFPVVLKNAL